MNFNRLTITILMGATSTLAHARGTEPAGTVHVCVSHALREQSLDAGELRSAQMFRSIGVNVEFHNSSRECSPAANTIIVDIVPEAPKTVTLGAMARANMTDGVHIDVFEDRFFTLNPKLRLALVAHVLVHEITHILEGVARHSETGVMKALWTHQDHERMCIQPLAFAPEDIALIRAGVAARAAGALPTVAQTNASEAPSVPATR
jgi:hypothetical protein